MIQFTPGPSQLYFTVPDHIKRAVRDGVPSLSHRSKTFEHIFQETFEGLKSLLGIPAGYQMAFTGSATEIWERSIQNLAAQSSVHLVNGAFSKKYFETALQLGKHAIKTEVPAGQGFSIAHAWPYAEMIAVTLNETSTGVAIPADYLKSLRQLNPNALIVVDAVSALPFPAIDFHMVDSVFFSVQKGFGLPAGLGVWLYNERCLDKAKQMSSKGISIGTYHSLPSFAQHGKRNQTPETPNVLGIYLLSKVTGDFNHRGIQAIRNETIYKSAILYQCLDTHPLVKPFVRATADRSSTVIVAETGQHTETLTQMLQKNGLYPGEGYGESKINQLRFANFPAHSKEVYEQLVDVIQSFT